MNRSTGVLASLFPLLLLCATPAKAQTNEVRFGFPELSFWINPLSFKELGSGEYGIPNSDSKDLAQAKFEAAHADPQKLARAMLEAVRINYDAREQEFLAGRGTLEFLLDSARRLLEAERAVFPNQPDQLAALERYWARARQSETINQERYDAGRIAIQDLLETRRIRLEAEIWLRELAGKDGPQPSGVSSPGAFPDFLEDKGLAKALRAAARADLGDLRRARLEAARGVCAARQEEFLAGRGALNFLLASMRQLLEAEQAVYPRPSDRLATLERYWEQAKQNEAINWERWEAGRIPIKDYADTRYVRLQAEIGFAQERAVNTKPGFAAIPLAREEIEPFDPKELSKAKFRAAHADVRELARAKLQAAEISFDSRWKEFVAGRGNLEFLLEAARRVLDALGDAYPGRAERTAALERYWEYLFLCDRINQERYEAGRVSLDVVMWSRYARREAATWLGGASTQK